MRGDTAKRLGGDFDIDDIAELGVALIFQRLVDAELLVRLINVVHDGLAHVHADGFLCTIGIDENVIGHAVVIALIGGNERLPHAVEHVIDRNALFFFQQIQSVKKFCVHHFF